MKKKLIVPNFKNEEQESKFWADLDLSEYFESTDFRHISFPNLKPTTRSISLRIPEWLIFRVKEKANELDMPYQSLMKQYIQRGVMEKD